MGEQQALLDQLQRVVTRNYVELFARQKKLEERFETVRDYVGRIRRRLKIAPKE